MSSVYKGNKAHTEVAWLEDMKAATWSVVPRRMDVRELYLVQNAPTKGAEDIVVYSGKKIVTVQELKPGPIRSRRKLTTKWATMQ